MTHNPCGHVDLRVNDREVARAFYEALLPALGFAEFHRGRQFDTFSAAGDPPFKPWVGYIENPEHRPRSRTRCRCAERLRSQADACASNLRW